MLARWPWEFIHSCIVCAAVADPLAMFSAPGREQPALRMRWSNGTPSGVVWEK
jgi:hypothetical protein